jgi:hypothetical protein
MYKGRMTEAAGALELFFGMRVATSTTTTTKMKMMTATVSFQPRSVRRTRRSRADVNCMLGGHMAKEGRNECSQITRLLHSEICASSDMNDVGKRR